MRKQGRGDVTARWMALARQARLDPGTLRNMIRDALEHHQGDRDGTWWQLWLSMLHDILAHHAAATTAQRRALFGLAMDEVVPRARLGPGRRM